MVTGYRFNTTDLESLPENGNRYEVIDGELYVTTAPHLRHQVTQGQTALVLGKWNEESGLGWVLPGPGVIFTREDAVIPDLVWVSRERLPLILRHDGHLHAAPELVVEVLSPGAKNEHRDREAKLKLYSAWGVAEYWLLDPMVRTMLIYRRVQAKLELAGTLGVTDELTSPLLPGFRVTVGTLFPALPPVPEE